MAKTQNMVMPWIIMVIHPIVGILNIGYQKSLMLSR